MINMRNLSVILLMILGTNTLFAQEQTFPDGLSIISTWDKVKKVRCNFSKYNRIEIKDGSILGYVNHKCHVVDSLGIVIIPSNYENIRRVGDIFKGYMDKKYYLMDKKGQLLVHMGYDFARIVPDEKIIWVKNNEKWGMLDLQGNELTPCIYDQLKPDHGIISAMLDQKWGILDKKGNILVPMKYEYIKYFTKNIYKTIQNGMVGLIDAKEQIIVEPIYTDIFIGDEEISFCTCSETVILRSFGEFEQYRDKGFQLVDADRILMCKEPKYQHININDLYIINN